MSIFEGIRERFLLRAGVVAMFGVLGLLAGLSLVTQRHTTDLAQRTETTNCVAALYQDIDHWVQEEKSIEREYRIEGSSTVAADHARAAARVDRLPRHGPAPAPTPPPPPHPPAPPPAATSPAFAGSRASTRSPPDGSSPRSTPGTRRRSSTTP